MARVLWMPEDQVPPTQRRMETLINIPKQISIETTLDPPEENKGSVMPTTGRRPMDMPRLNTVCQKMMAPTPNANPAPNRSFACEAMYTEWMARAQYSASRAIHPRNPNSSANTLNGKSECWS